VSTDAPTPPDTEPGKRPAGEFLSAFEEPVEVPAEAGPRPHAIYLGMAFLVLRILGTVLWSVETVVRWDDITDVDADGQPDGVWVAVVIAGLYVLWAVILAFIARLLWRGWNGVRILILCWTTVNILIFAVGYFARGEHITLHTSLLTLSLDILVLLALSGPETRTWTRSRSTAMLRARRERRAQRAQRHARPGRTRR
jgi:hypothetical protein